MQKTFALGRVAAALTVMFMLLLWFPLAAIGAVDAFGRPAGDSSRGGLFLISAVGCAGLAWSVRFLRPRIVITDDRLTLRTAFDAREIALGSVARLWRKRTRTPRSRTDELTLGLEGEPPLVIDLDLIHDAEQLVDFLQKRTGAKVVSGL